MVILVFCFNIGVFIWFMFDLIVNLWNWDCLNEYLWIILFDNNFFKVKWKFGLKNV